MKTNNLSTMNDQILYWNEVALEANRISHSQFTSDGEAIHKGVNGPTLSSRALAIVHLAMYDAYVGASKAQSNVANRTALNHYLTPNPTAGVDASIDAAIATAAHATLSKLYPKLKSMFDQKHLDAGLDGVNYDAGFNFGIEVANKIWALRANDPSESDDGYSISMAPGRHRQDPDNIGQDINAPFYGANSKGFAVTKRWGIAPPPAVGSIEYKKALDQVRAKGIAPELMGTLPPDLFGNRRTPDETLIGIYWGYDGALKLGTPPRLYNQIVRKIAIEKGNTLEDNARLFALVNVAMGDAGILAWDQKYLHNLWRPVLGVREDDTSMGAIAIGGADLNNDCDPSWLPLGAPKTNGTPFKDKNFTPSFPAYPSGHATFGAAALHMTKLFYGGDNFDGVSFVSDECNGINKDVNGTTRTRHLRKFNRGIDQMIFENGASRVYLGVHWFFDAFALKPNALLPASPAGRNLTIDETNIVVNTATPDAVGIGGVPLGLAIAEDIFTSGLTLSPVGPR